MIIRRHFEIFIYLLRYSFIKYICFIFIYLLVDHEFL